MHWIIFYFIVLLNAHLVYDKEIKQAAGVWSPKDRAGGMNLRIVNMWVVYKAWAGKNT